MRVLVRTSQDVKSQRTKCDNRSRGQSHAVPGAREWGQPREARKNEEMVFTLDYPEIMQLC